MGEQYPDTSKLDRLTERYGLPVWPDVVWWQQSWWEKGAGGAEATWWEEEPGDEEEEEMEEEEVDAELEKIFAV